MAEVLHLSESASALVVTLETTTMLHFPGYIAALLLRLRVPVFLNTVEAVAASTTGWFC